ncbi:hypothetical protein KDA_39450 [Dictyobacter alpinus]|uniref:HTH luxR-type domain-containing protein n=1 Tax=Dictyobacter alpinus TaxID=2014873 RepID=A0A402BAM6_9CHLR|nr:tetratricopeptide repeat protein [Dictyobacter alpinus]GCE28461.1 hypothetical protein KDA_39450 [Dictyobacter alpinus]
MTRSTPTVRNDTLFYQEQDQSYCVPVGSADWYIWLAGATSFSFTSAPGSFTARKEQAGNKRGGDYWKAYSKRKGKLLHAYIGKSQLLSLERLQAIAVQLAQSAEEQQHLPATEPSFSYNHNLPMQPMPLIGREKETAQICALLQRSDVRLLTIAGPGGVGKTSLALEVMRALRESFPGGIFYISLGLISDADLVLPTIAQKLGFVETKDEPLLERVAAYLHDKHSLLVLDNFEQIMPAAPLLAELLVLCPQLKIMVTSREILHLRGEHEFVVPCLSLPDLQNLPTDGDFSAYPSMLLFAQRAAAVKHDFQITPANAAVIAEICTCLDGLPLALELAAARSKHLSPTMLLARLEQRLVVLTSGARDLPRRQQTLRDTLDWSYELLNQDEQKIFRYLSVFVRGCTMASAESFCTVLQDDQIACNAAILDIIASLIDKSFLQQREQADGEMRLSMLETIQEYGQMCLQAAGEQDKAARTHAFHYLALAEQAEPELRRATQAQWLQRLDQENDNLRAALQWFSAQSDPESQEAALRLCAALWRFWLIRNRQQEGYQWAEKALLHSAHVSPALQAKAYFATATLADSQEHYERSVELWQRSLAIYAKIDDQVGVAATLNKLGTATARKAPVESHTLFERSLSLARLHMDDYGVADALESLAQESFAFGFLTEARATFEERLVICRRLEDRRSIAYCLESLGQIAAHLGDYPQANQHLRECLMLHREIGDRIGLAFALLPLAIVTLYQGDYSTAHSLLEEFRVVIRELGNQHNLARSGSTRDLPQLQFTERTPISQILTETFAIFKETGNDEGIASKLFALGCIDFSQGNFSDARKSLSESLTIFQHLGNRVMKAAVHNMQGQVEAHQGNYDRARIHLEECLLITREIDDHWHLASRLGQLGLILLNQGNIPRARILIEESMQAAQESGDPRYIAQTLHIHGLLSLHTGDYAMAQQRFTEGLNINSEMRSGSTRAYFLADLGLLAIQQKNHDRAKILIEESLALCQRVGDRWFIPSCLERLGEVSAMQGQPLHAARLWGTACTMRAMIGAPMPPIEQTLYQQTLALVRQQLIPERFSAEWKTGELMTLEEVLDSIRTPITIEQPSITPIAETPEGQPARPIIAPPTPNATLTSREKEVLQLLANGLTNIQIAARLVISPRTVQTHLSTIYAKIGVTTRSAATRYAIEQNLA